jgi:hypothetical protein
MVRLLVLYNLPADPAAWPGLLRYTGAADMAKFATTGAATLLYEVAEV